MCLMRLLYLEYRPITILTPRSGVWSVMFFFTATTAPSVERRQLHIWIWFRFIPTTLLFGLSQSTSMVDCHVCLRSRFLSLQSVLISASGWESSRRAQVSPVIISPGQMVVLAVDYRNWDIWTAGAGIRGAFQVSNHIPIQHHMLPETSGKVQDVAVCLMLLMTQS